MRYLITGLPRMRSAWLAALFECAHDAAVSGIPDGGLCDPCAACLYPRKALEYFTGSPIVIVRRDEAESRESFERWVGAGVTQWVAMTENLKWFAQHSKHIEVPYADLNDYGKVAAMYHYCTGNDLQKKRFEFFDVLRIEQHKQKAELRLMKARSDEVR